MSAGKPAVRCSDCGHIGTKNLGLDKPCRNCGSLVKLLYVPPSWYKQGVLDLGGITTCVGEQAAKEKAPSVGKQEALS